MQEQAAPPRFRGVYPHEMSIPKKYLPTDRWFSEALLGAKQQQDVSETANAFVGHFPKLILRVKDPEILALAGGDTLSRFDDIDCKDISCTCAAKPKYEQLFSSTEADHDAILYNTCKRTIFAAAKRQMKSAPVPSKSVADDFVLFARMKIDEYLGDHLRDFGYSYEQWYNHLTYAKQKRMDQMQEFVHGVKALEAHYSSIEQTPAWMFHYEAICKAELQAIDGKPRMVCKIPDLVKYVMGPITWKLEELAQDYFPVYCGGMNLSEMEDKINAYIDQGFTIVAEGDGSAFDNTQDVMLKAVDRYIYNTILDKVHHVPRELFEYVANQHYKVMDVIHVEHGSRQVLMQYAVLGTVFSGDTDTTLMNTIRMGLYNWYTAEMAGLVIKQDFVCFSKGDDFTVMYHYKLGLFNVQDAYRAYWLAKAKPDGASYDGCDERVYGLGQILKFIEKGAPDSIKFCSLRAWYKDDDHIILTRDPAKFLTLSKYSRKTKVMSYAKVAEFLVAQGEAIRASYSGIEYFDTMAMLYEARAAQFRSVVEKFKKYPRVEVDRRRTLELGPAQRFDGYNYTPRHTAYLIKGDYWSTIKLVERNRSGAEPFTAKQLATINSQVNNEFYPDDLKMLLGQWPA